MHASARPVRAVRFDRPDTATMPVDRRCRGWDRPGRRASSAHIAARLAVEIQARRTIRWPRMRLLRGPRCGPPSFSRRDARGASVTRDCQERVGVRFVRVAVVLASESRSAQCARDEVLAAGGRGVRHRAHRGSSSTAETIGSGGTCARARFVPKKRRGGISTAPIAAPTMTTTAKAMLIFLALVVITSDTTLG